MRFVLHSERKCLRLVVSSVSHVIRMLTPDRPSPHLLHRGLGDPVNRRECVVWVWPMRSLGREASMRESVQYRPTCGSIMSLCHVLIDCRV